MSHHELFFTVKDIPLFKKMTNQSLLKFVNQIKFVRKNKGENLFKKGEPINVIFYIVEGCLEITQNNSQDKMKHLTKGEMFPLTEIYKEGIHLHNGVVLVDSLLLYIPIHTFEQLLMTQPRINIELIKLFQKEIIHLHELFKEEIIKKNVK